MAALLPGIRITDAPRFHSDRSWADRLRLNSGVVIDGDRVLPRDDWRQPSADELALLTTSDGEPTDALAIFNIPQRLLAKWWTIAANESTNADANHAAFLTYSREVLEYLHFKKLPLPPSCTL